MTGLPLGVLGRAAGPLEAVFLAFFDTGVPSDEALAAQGRLQVCVEGHQGTGDAVADGLTWCREGKGPILLEMNTYRYRGHSMSDPAKYRSREEVQEVRAKSDPIDQLRLKLLKLKGVTEARLKEIDGEVREVVAEAAAFAESAPEPEAAELYTEVLS